MSSITIIYRKIEKTYKAAVRCKLTKTKLIKPYAKITTAWRKCFVSSR